jgi:hypothetical protein
MSLASFLLSSIATRRDEASDVGVGRAVAAAAAAKVNSHYGEQRDLAHRRRRRKRKKNKVASTDRLLHVARLLPLFCLTISDKGQQQIGDDGVGSTSIPEYAAIFYDDSRRLFNDRHVSTKMCTAGSKKEEQENKKEKSS